jgi:hypothetical protein
MGWLIAYAWLSVGVSLFIGQFMAVGLGSKE